jgi:hypothetical protein
VSRKSYIRNEVALSQSLLLVFLKNGSAILDKKETLEKEARI